MSSVTLLLHLLLASSALATGDIDVCSLIANSDCHCVNATSTSSPAPPSLPQPDVRCNFTTKPPAPLFPDNVTSSGVPLTLNVLDLSDNELEDLPDDFLRHVVSVRVVRLGDNRLTGVPRALGRLKALTSLDLSANRLASLPWHQLSNIGGLRAVNASHNRLSDLAPAPGTPRPTMQSLAELDLSHNLIASLDGGLLSSEGLQHMRWLSLSHNRLTRVGQDAFRGLALSLLTLHLSHNGLLHVDGQALRPLRHLRRLDLAYNGLMDVQGLQFPQHLQALDLSHCALTILDHCQLSGLADLTALGLNGNDLRCSCQLYLLLQWYLNQHHQTGTPANATTAIASSWTCRDMDAPAPSSTATPATAHTTTVKVETTTKEDHDGAKPPAGSSGGAGWVRAVSELQHCKDTSHHCPTPEHSEHHLKGASKMAVTLEVASSDDTLMASWTLEENGDVSVSGFTVAYMPENGEPVTSPVLPGEARSFVLKVSGLEEHFVVCLQVLTSQTTVVHQECRNFKDEPTNVFVGILAGVVFLLPCAVIMIYVLFKDRAISRALGNYGHISDDEKGAAGPHPHPAGPQNITRLFPPAKDAAVASNKAVMDVANGQSAVSSASDGKREGVAKDREGLDNAAFDCSGCKDASHESTNL